MMKEERRLGFWDQVIVINWSAIGQMLGMCENKKTIFYSTNATHINLKTVIGKI